MDQSVVPQFIDVESKIVGPITTRQFIMIIIWGLFMFITNRLLDTTGFALFALFWTVLMGMFAFYKVQGRPFYIFLLIVVQGNKKPGLRVWRHMVSASDIKKKEEAKRSGPAPTVPRPKVLGSRLSELSLIVDTGGMYGGKETNNV